MRYKNLFLKLSLLFSIILIGCCCEKDNKKSSNIEREDSTVTNCCQRKITAYTIFAFARNNNHYGQDWDQIQGTDGGTLDSYTKLDWFLYGNPIIRNDTIFQPLVQYQR